MKKRRCGMLAVLLSATLLWQTPIAVLAQEDAEDATAVTQDFFRVDAENDNLVTQTINVNEMLYQEGGFEFASSGEQAAAGEESVIIEEYFPGFLSAGPDIEGARKTILEGLREFRECISIEEYSIPFSMFVEIYVQLINDNPDLFYVTGGGGISYDSSTEFVLTLTPEYKNGVGTEQVQIFEEKVQEILQTCTHPGMLEEEKALALHDYLASHCVYDLTYSRFDAYSALVDGQAVCQGYALAYQVLLSRADVEVKFVESSSMNHSWNQVKIDGEWYHVDVTWDDPTRDSAFIADATPLHPATGYEGYSLHRYFLLSDAAIQDNTHNHSEWISEQVCTSTKYDSDAYWIPLQTAVLFIDGNKYYLRYENNSLELVENDTSVLWRESCVWPVVGSTDSHWNGCFTGFSYEDGVFYYNTSNEVKAYNLSTGTVESVYIYGDPESQLYGSFVDNGVLTMLVGENPFCYQDSDRVFQVPLEKEEPVTSLVITSQPTSVTVPDGAQATFTVAANGDGLTYQWELCYAGDDTFRKCTFVGADTASLTVDVTKARDGYSFRCVITDERGQSVTSEVAKLTLKVDTVTVITGDFGVNNGLHWEYDTETKTVTVSGEDEPKLEIVYDEYGYPTNQTFPIETERFQFDNCKITSSMGYFFAGLRQLKEIDFNGLTTSNLKNMEWMFSGCTSLTDLDMSGFDVSNVTDMGSMFYNCSNLTSLNLSGFVTGNVTDMSGIFRDCSSLTSLDLSSFDTGNVAYMDNMFFFCSGLTSLDISGFDTSNVISMQNMFAYCNNLTSLDVSGFDTSNVTYISGMFYGCSSLTVLDVSGFDTSKVTDMGSMFYGCSSLTNLDVSGFNTSNVSGEFGMQSMFDGCSSLSSLDMSSFDTSKITNMCGMFADCGSLTSLNVSSFDTSKVTDMSDIFYCCSNLTSLDVSGFDTSNVTDMSCMFYGCSSLEGVDVSRFDTGKVTDMEYMFSFCNSITSLNVSGFDTGNVTNLSAMFQGCTNLPSLDVSGFDTKKAIQMNHMFSECNSLSDLDVSGFDTGNATDIAGMFQLCTNLASLDVSGFDTSKATSTAYMFNGCSSLNSLDVSGFDTSNVTNMECMFSNCNKLTSLVTPAKMGNVTADLPATFYTLDGASTTVLSKDFAGTTLYKEGHVPEKPEEPETPAISLVITSQPVAASVFDGEQATFSIAATGDGLTYQWQLCYAGDSTFRKCTFSGAGTSTLTVDATKARNGYKFRCVVTNEKGESLTSDAAVLTVSTRDLGVSLVASQPTADPGDKVTFTAQGNGGDGNYQYKFIINDTANDKWYKLQDFSSNNTIEWTATTAGTKRIMVDIRDGSGKSVGKNVSVLVNGIPELSAKFTASAYEVNSGDTVTLTAAAMGGSGKYNYKFIINDKTDDKWYRLQDFGSNNVITWKATTPGIKRLMVDVMDSQGRKFGTNITITVKAVE